MKHLFVFAIAVLGLFDAVAQEYNFEDDQALIEAIFTDSIVGKTGSVVLEGAHCTLNVPDGFVYLDHDQSRHLLVDYWENHESKVEGALGTLVSNEARIYNDVEIAYVVSYDNAGYVSDKDATSINYDELLADIQKSEKEYYNDNPDMPKLETVGWAWHPTYSSARKVLGWAKILRNSDGYECVNYDVRVLGKDGFVIITAVAEATADVDSLLLSKNDAIISSVIYDPGYTYADFDPNNDHFAEWTIGGLVAGKVLAKVGFWTAIAKFWKLILIGIIGFSATIGKKILGVFRRKDEDCLKTE